MNKINRANFLSEIDLSLQTYIDSPIKIMAATNQKSVLSSSTAIKVSNAIPIQIKKCCFLFINRNMR